MPKRLLLPSARSGVLVEKPSRPFSPWWRRAVLVFGLVAILIGAADAVTRFADRFLGEDAAFNAFAPAILLLDPTLEGEVQGTSTAVFVPARLAVPSIGIDAQVEQVGKTAEGAMATPKVLANVGWYRLGSKPGEEGNAVFAGHVNNALGLPGVFKKLSQIKKGDTVEVAGSVGETLVYEVESIISYEESVAPLQEIFANKGPSKVVLITCEGVWDETTHTFSERLVVVAHLKNP
ncbi:MAG: class F sortase [Candidatus Adlerbacteria bacterium]|nr:class F sortase [Candidatus Adlerbacteria bacterium]